MKRIFYILDIEKYLVVNSLIIRAENLIIEINNPHNFTIIFTHTLIMRIKNFLKFVLYRYNELCKYLIRPDIEINLNKKEYDKF